MSNAQAFCWGIWSLVLFTVVLACLCGSISINGISLTAGWHRWAICIGSVLWLAVIIHSAFWGGTK